MANRFWLLYGGLLLLRLILALSKSYIHPDEMFQGSEIIVGDIFDWKVIRTWEFVSFRPIRSIIPIYIFQSPLLYHLHVFNTDNTTVIFYVLRTQQFLWTLSLDGLLYGMTRSKNSLLLFASSYVTLAYQTHAFSNAWESILVLATLHASQELASSLWLGPLACLGLFTRVSSAGFMIPLALVRIKKMFVRDKGRWTPDETEIQLNAFSVLTFTAVAAIMIYFDSHYYTGHWLDIYSWNKGIYTVWNYLTYNLNHSNLALHGIHPRYTHLINIAVLLGPGLFLVPKLKRNLYTASMLCGFVALSIAPHQEARFLLPCVVLFFAGLQVNQIGQNFWIVWILFNAVMASFMGVFHQCGVIPAALHIAKEYPNASVTWTKSYPAPVHLLGPGVKIEHVYGKLSTPPTTDLFVAPISRALTYPGYDLVYRDSWHVNLDDFGELGFEVFKQRGMGIYEKHDVEPEE